MTVVTPLLVASQTLFITEIVPSANFDISNTPDGPFQKINLALSIT